MWPSVNNFELGIRVPQRLRSYPPEIQQMLAETRFLLGAVTQVGLDKWASTWPTRSFKKEPTATWEDYDISTAVLQQSNLKAIPDTSRESDFSAPKHQRTKNQLGARPVNFRINFESAQKVAGQWKTLIVRRKYLEPVQETRILALQRDAGSLQHFWVATQTIIHAIATEPHSA